MGESCRNGETCRYARWAWIWVVTKWPPTHEVRGCLQYHVHAGLATAEDMRHYFHGVVNLTNVFSTQVHGRTSEGVECCRTSSDPILCVHPLPLWVMWPAQGAQGGGNTAQLTRSEAARRGYKKIVGISARETSDSHSSQSQYLACQLQWRI